MSETAIVCSGLRKRYGGVVAVDGLDLETKVGECFGLLGPNGAGKTTTVEILEGLNEPTEGTVEILGMRWASDADRLRERIGVALQETNISERLTVLETLRLFRSFYRRGPSTAELLAMVSLEEKKDAWVEKLSGGQRQRLAIACAMAGAPDLVFLDEPTTGLDPQSRRQLWDMVIDFRARGGSVLLTTHYMDEAERLCDRIAVVDRGRVIANGTPRQLIASLGGEEVIEFTVAQPLAIEELLALPAVRGARSQADGYVLTVAELHVALPATLTFLNAKSLSPLRLSTHRATLEDVFVHLTGRQLRD